MRALASAVLVVWLVAGCSTAPSDVTPTSTPQPSWSPWTTQGLRGSPVDTTACPTTDIGYQQALEAEPVDGAVTVLTLCAPDRTSGSPHMVHISRGQPGFRLLGSVLALPDRTWPDSGPHVCLLGLVELAAYAQTATDDWRLRLPADACGTPRTVVVKTMTRFLGRADEDAAG